MRSKPILKTVCVLALPLLLVSGAVAQRGSAPADIRAAIDAANREFRDALANGDVDDLVELFTRDARIMAPLQPTVKGRAAIREYMAYWIEFGIRDVKIVTEEIYGSGDTAVEIGYSTPVLADGVELPRTRDMAVWKYEDDRWRVHRLLSNQ
jgi:uncharacterized protein (TIGR02246 family)